MAWCSWELREILDQFGARSCPNAPHIRSSSVQLRSQLHFSVLISIKHQSTKPFIDQLGSWILYKNFERLDLKVFARTIEGSYYTEFSVVYTANKSLMT